MNRRTLLIHGFRTAGMALGCLILDRGSIRAQAGTPAPDSGGMDLPELVISVDDATFALPTEVRAARVLMTVKNTGSKGLHFFAARIPDEVTDEQVASDMMADAEPAWFDMSKLTFLGNPDWPPVGGQAQGIVDLAAGRWILVDPIDGRMPSILTVAEGEIQTGPAPEIHVAVSMIEMDLEGLEQPVPAGRSVWEITNAGALEHEVAILPVAEGTTKEDVIEMLASMFSGEGDPSSFVPIGGQGIASRGVTTWQVFDLAPGSYAAVCMTPMQIEDPTPHAMMGMVKIFVAE